MRLFLFINILWLLPMAGICQFKQQVKRSVEPVYTEIHELINVNDLIRTSDRSVVNESPVVPKLTSADLLSLSDVRGRVTRINGVVRTIRGAPRGDDNLFADPLSHFMSYYGAALEVDRTSVEVIKDHTDKAGRRHVRLQQMYHRIPVYGHQATIHGDTEQLDYYMGNLKKVEVDVVTPSLTTDQLEDILIATYGIKKINRMMPAGLNRILTGETEINLVIIVDEHNNASLAYKTVFYPDGIHRKEAILDAHTGVVIKEFDAYCNLHNHTAESSADMPPSSGFGQDLFGVNQTFNTWQVGDTYYLLDANRPMYNASASDMPNDPVGAIWTLAGNGQDPQSSQFGVSQVTSNSTNWDNPTAVSAHLNGSKSYTYFLNTFGRNSINGQGGTIVSILNAGAGNAFWNGQAIFYGNADNSFNDLARGLDVAGHEMSHGVIQNTANLEYFGESGALNESFADIFGAMIDRDDWLIGEDVVKTNAFPSGALRNMMDPHNGGNGQQDLNRGWQPAAYSERFTGSEDNNGVHINSGIVNRAYYLFANNGSVGRSKAEQVYFKVLDDYLTRSSDFADLRAALEQVVSMDYGTNSAEWEALQNALNTTQIPGGGGVIDDPVLDQNPGDDFLLVTTDTQKGIFHTDPDAADIQLLSELDIISRPSLTDDGQVAVFVDSDNNLRYLLNFPAENDIGYLEQNPQGTWRNVIISKDANLIAAVTSEPNNNLHVFNLNADTNGQPSEKVFQLYNPTFTDGVTTGDVLYADAMEFSADGQFIIYDAINQIRSSSGTDIEYWDIGFIDVWDRANERYEDGRVQKLFNQLPEDVSIGNPTFSKNSPNVIAFDLLDGQDWSILGMNIETNTYQTITSNNKIGYPTYSTDDTELAYDRDDNQGAAIYRIGLDDTKISSATAATAFLVEGAHWAVWFGTGERPLVDAQDLEEDLSAFTMFPNPVRDEIRIVLSSDKILSEVYIQVVNSLGQVIHTERRNQVSAIDLSIHVRDYTPGLYMINIASADKRLSRSFIKQ